MGMYSGAGMRALGAGFMAGEKASEDRAHKEKLDQEKTALDTYTKLVNSGQFVPVDPKKGSTTGEILRVGDIGFLTPSPASKSNLLQMQIEKQELVNQRQSMLLDLQKVKGEITDKLGQQKLDELEQRAKRAESMAEMNKIKAETQIAVAQLQRMREEEKNKGVIEQNQQKLAMLQVKNAIAEVGLDKTLSDVELARLKRDYAEKLWQNKLSESELKIELQKERTKTEKTKGERIAKEPKVLYTKVGEDYVPTIQTAPGKLEQMELDGTPVSAPREIESEVAKATRRKELANIETRITTGKIKAKRGYVKLEPPQLAADVGQFNDTTEGDYLYALKKDEGFFSDNLPIKFPIPKLNGKRVTAKKLRDDAVKHNMSIWQLLEMLYTKQVKEPKQEMIDLLRSQEYGGRL